MKYVSDYKQRFEVVVVPPHLAPMLLKLAHDDLGHNGTARTYMILRRSYYWKGMKSFIATYVKRCDLCRQHNATATHYVKGTFEIPKALDFISMDYRRILPTQLTGKSVCFNRHAHWMGLVRSNTR